ncbi:hypothetical protein [Actinomyces sp.]
MGQTQASITVVDSSQREDYVIPVGTTIAGLLALIEVDLTKLSARLTLGGGRPVDLGAVIGRDIPSGSVVTIVGAQESARAVADDQRSSNNLRFQPALVAVSFLFTAIIVTLLGVVTPALALFHEDVNPLPSLMTATWGRLALGIACGFIWLCPLIGPRNATRGFILVGCCAAAGVSIAIAATPLPQSISLLPVTVAWSCLVVSGLVLFARPTASARVTVQCFALIAGTLTVAALSALSTIRFAPLIFTASIFFVALSPHLALQVPDHQVLDLPLVMKRLPSIRLTVLPPPSRITPMRVNKTLAEANDRARTILTSATIIAFVSGVITAYQMPIGEEMPYTGYATLALCLLAILALITNARSKRDRLTHYGPRAAALAIWIALFFAPGWDRYILRSTGESVARALMLAQHLVLPLSLCLLALIVPATALIRSGREPSALVGRLIDIVQGLSLTLLLPAATYGSGLFDLVWRKVL